MLSLAFIYVHGMEYVAWPRLNPLTDIINYDGPGMKAKGKGRGIVGLTQFAKGKTKQSNMRWAGQEIEMGTLARKRVD